MSGISDEMTSRITQTWNRTSWWNLLVVVPWALGLIFFFYSSKVDRAIAQRQQTTYGIVTTNEPSNHDRYRYEFSVNGKLYTGWQIPSRVEFQIGQRVLVYYDPLDPTKSSLNDFAESGNQVFGLVPLLAFGIVAVAVFIFLRQRRSFADLRGKPSNS